MVEVDGGGYLIAAQHVTPVYRGLLFIRTDQNGDTLWTKLYKKDSVAYYTGKSGSLIKTYDGGYALGGSIKDVNDTVNTSDALLVKLDANGDTMWTKVFGGPYYDAARICQQTSDSGYVLIGDTDTTSNGDDDFYIIKTDSLGNLEWEKNHGGNGYQVALSGQPTLDGGYIMSGFTGAVTPIHRLIKVDAVGDFEWAKVYSSVGGCYVTQASDSGYVLSGQKFVGGTLGDQGVLRKVDKDGNQVWEKTYGIGFTMEWFDSRPIIMSNGDIVVAGTKQPGAGGARGWVARVNNIGDSLWIRSFTTAVPTAPNQFYDIKPTQDGGFVMCGSGWDANQDIWIVKVDSMGCEIPNCDAVAVPEILAANQELKVYPNPTEGKFRVESSEFRVEKIEVFDVFGRVVYRYVPLQPVNQLTINLSTYPSGIYFVRVGQAVRKLVLAR